MAKLIIPTLTDQRKAGFAKHNVKIIENSTLDEFESAVTDYLNKHNVLHLATCSNNEPRSTTVDYFNNCMTVHILSEGGGKLSNLKTNPRVSYTIADPYNPAEDFFGASGLQVWGIASVFRKNDDPQRFQGINKYSRYAEAVEKQGLDQKAGAMNFNVITIIPAKIIYLNYRAGYRKATWEQEA